MAYAKKTNPAAFGDILAGLGGAERPAPSEPAPRVAVKTAAGINLDVSWVQSARLRAVAAQMAQRAADPRLADAIDQQRGRGEDETAGRRMRGSDQPAAEASPDDAGVRAYDFVDPDEPAAATPPPHEPAAPEAAGRRRTSRANPMRALRRLLGKIPKGLRIGASGAAKHAEPRPARGPSAAPRPSAPNQRPPVIIQRKSEDEAIADELGLGADLAIGDLQRIRREFAKKNHPDRFEPAQRSSAARRMTIANMLIDARLKQGLPPL